MERTYESRFEDRLAFDKEHEECSLTFDKRASGSLLIFVQEGCRSLKLHLKGLEYSYVKIFVENQTSEALEIEADAVIDQDAKIEMGLLDLQDSPLKLRVKGDLDKQGATMDFLSGQLCLKGQEKDSDIQINNNSPFTYGMMHNFAVVFDEGLYKMVAAGRIIKGSYNSESHQETRVLTMGVKHKAQAIPILYIDENDVKASHALSIGQPDAQQLYYLRSRGLTKEQAMGLLSIGYFKPVIDLIDDKALHEQIRQEMETKVGLYEY